MTNQPSSAQPDKWSDPVLDAMRLRGDPLADSVIADIFGSGEVDAVDRVLLALRTNSQVLPVGLPPTVSDYFDQTASALVVDQDQLKSAEDMFALYGPEILVCLGFYSLPASYAARKGVQVLHRTAFLEKRPMRRVFETTRMMVDVMTSGGLAPSGAGVRTIQKVRLMHAAIRHMLTHDKSRPWDPSLGVPINQEDLAGTLMTFSYVVLTGLERMGLSITTEHAESYIHVWSAIGSVLGLEPELLPWSVKEAEHLTKRVRERQIEPSPEGRALTLALIDGFAGLLPDLPDAVPAAMVHYFLDSDPIMHEDVARMLDVPDGGWTGVLTRLVSAETALAHWLDNEASVHAGSMRWLSRRLVSGLLEFQGSGELATFSIPDRLYADWDLDVPGARV